MGQNFKCISRLGDSLKIHSKTPQLWLENFPSAWIQFFNMPWWICCRNTTWHHAWHIALKLNSSCFIIDCCFELTWAHQKKQNEFSLKLAQCTRWVGHFLFDICLLIKVGKSQGDTFIFAHLQKLKQITDLQLLTYFEKSLGSVIWFIFLKMGQKSNYLLRFPLIYENTSGVWYEITGNI